MNDRLVIVLSFFMALIAIAGADFSYTSVNNIRSALTSHATDTATTNLTVGTNAAISFGSNDFIDFGNGSVANGSVGGVLSSTGLTTNTTGFLTVTKGFVLENIGNTNVSLNIMTAKSAAQFIGGTSPTYQYNITNKEANSCATPHSGFSLGTYYNTNTTSPGTFVCDNFQSIDSSDTLRIDIKLYVPSDSYTGALTDIMTATATGV
jgi:hypothetical protein